jgi:hypothetical protein
MKQYRVSQSTISLLKSGKLKEASRIAQLYETEVKPHNDVLAEATALAERGGASILDILVTVAERRQIDGEVLGAIIRKDTEFKKRVEAEAITNHALKLNYKPERRKSRDQQ